jgi:SAM-dependent methyltransferase
MLKDYLANMYIKALELNNQNVMTALSRTTPHKSILDVGCWDGELTVQYAKAAKTKKIYGIELIEEAAKKAQKRGITTYSFAADKDPWPFKDKSLDCIVTNQVVEHLPYLDYFFSESSRVLKKGGIFINSTNNLSSWHNMFALALGWAPFDLTNASSKASGIGNPLAVHANESDDRGYSWTHRCIYTARWFDEWEQLYGFKKVMELGAGFYPFPASLGNVFKTHCAFFTMVARKA